MFQGAKSKLSQRCVFSNLELFMASLIDGSHRNLFGDMSRWHALMLLIAGIRVSIVALPVLFPLDMRIGEVICRIHS
jgi:hypothetical protein